MSTISSISGTLPALANQQVGSQRPPQAPPPQGGGIDIQQQVQTAAEQAGLDATEISQLHSELQDAIQSAHEQGLSRDEAVAQFDSILEDHGIDVQSFKEGIESLRQQQGTPPPPQSSETDDSESAQGVTISEFIDLMSNLPTGSLVDTAA